MHTQNLRDSGYEIGNYFTHWRGWFKRGAWEFAWSKRVSDYWIQFMLTLGGEDDRALNLSAGLLGVAFYLTIHKILPKAWAIGWFKRGEVQNPRWHEDSHGRQWGFYFHDDSFAINWGATVAAGGRDTKKYGHHWYFWAPWSWQQVRYEVRKPDGTWISPSGEHEPPYADRREVIVSAYKYHRKNNEWQHRIATYYVEIREWRWKTFAKLPFKFGPKKVKQSISISFNDEVGERSGSWKGGVTGCSEEMLPGETPVQTLQRMEETRKL